MIRFNFKNDRSEQTFTSIPYFVSMIKGIHLLTDHVSPVEKEPREKILKN